MELTPLSRRRVFLSLMGLALLAFGAGFWLASGFTSPLAETDFSYARTLAQGGGLAISARARHAEGYSDLLWVLLLSFGVGHGLSPAAAGKAIGLVCGIVSTALVGWLSSRLGKTESSPWDALPACVLALSSPFVLGAAGGVDSPLFSAILLLALAAFLLELDETVLAPTSAALLVLATLARPEAALYAALCLPAVFWAHHARLPRALEWLAVLLSGSGAIHFWRASYFGDAMAPAWYALTAPDSAASLSPDTTGAEQAASLLLSHWPLWLAALAFWGVLALAARPAGLWLAGCATASLVGWHLTGGDPSTDARWLAPLLPFAALALGEGLRRLIEFLYAPYPQKVSKDAPTLAAILTLALVVLRIAVPSVQQLTQVRSESPENIVQARR